MLLTGPSPVSFGQATPNIAIISVSFDLTGHTFTIIYGPQGGGIGPGQTKAVNGAIPAALQTALETHAKQVVENNEAWAANSSTVTTP